MANELYQNVFVVDSESVVKSELVRERCAVFRGYLVELLVLELEQKGDYIVVLVE